MDESAAFAIATQQAHKMGKTPKGYGTPEGKKKAKAKYTDSKKSYTATADPKGIGKDLDKKLNEKKAMENNTHTLVYLQGFSDELQKIAGPAGEAGKKLWAALKGSNLKKDVYKSVPTSFKVEVPRGRLGKAVGMKPKEVIQRGKTKVHVGTEKVPLREALKDENLRGEALKTLGARGAAVGAGGTAVVHGAKSHKKKHRQRLGKAYLSGARDMYARTRGSR